MALIEQNAPPRARESYAKTTRFSAWFMKCIAALRPLPSSHVRGLSDHHLRDIGLTSADIEAHRHRNPSQHSYHPRA